MNKLTIRRVERNDVESCATLEKLCYSEIEAATREYLAKRIEVYPDGFYVAELDGRIIGMINSGATHKDDITDEELKNLVGHVRNGKNGVIFSLAVHPEFQLRGIGRKLIEKIIRVLEEKQKQKVVLLCKDDLIGFYSALGFSYGGRSRSNFGGFTWHQMYYELPLPAWMITQHHNSASLEF
ncbi:GNAT family N-acetyltransferase [Desulfopila sp. IMCC35008]|uniref:GNAT family N-acetyltransferase n=1 Tax=Desulfopila sp. IMCC35008 TaxID=2653858 RepID=UPI0013D04F86|nr:N-acetyltransferase [Desulfopila sp. IMCC35008]